MNYNILDEKKYFKYVKNIHIKDKLKYGKTIRLGFGDVNFQLLFKTFQKFNYKGNFILQTARSEKSTFRDKKKFEVYNSYKPLMKKVLIIGLGSIGQRHLRNLKSLKSNISFLACRRKLLQY